MRLALFTFADALEVLARSQREKTLLGLLVKIPANMLDDFLAEVRI